MEHHIPFVYTPDPAAVAEEVAKLRKKITEDTKQAENALADGQRQRAALCYFSAWEALHEVRELTNADDDKLAEAEFSWMLGDFEDVGIKDLTKCDFRGCAGGIWLDFFKTTRLPVFREKAVRAGELMPDDTDYSADENYLARHPRELTELAVTLENYDILENDDGEILLAIHTLPQGDEQQAILFCDGGEHAILFKGPYRLIVCDFLHPEVRKKLPQRKTVLCYEDQNPSEETGEYLARVVFHAKTSKLAEILLHRLKKL